MKFEDIKRNVFRGPELEHDHTDHTSGANTVPSELTVKNSQQLMPFVVVALSRFVMD